jgi:hypothetical protein
MNKLFSILFLVAAIVSCAMGNVEAAAVSGAGIFLSLASPKLQGALFLQIVPGKFVVTETNPTSQNFGRPVEVPYMSRSEKALFDQLITLGRANPVTQKIIDQGGISFDPISYYVRANVTAASGRQAIVDNSIIQYVGVTNIPNGAALPQFYNFCFDKIAVRYASTNIADANVAAITGWSSIRASMPAALGNGHLIVTSNQNKILETPVSDFTSVAAITGGGERDYDGGVLEKPRFFLELINIGVEIAYAQGQSMPSVANNTYAVEIMFYGVQARLKA